jgi:DNA polymerase-1
MLREFGKRTAMNAPIQGSAADIIKMAMVKLDQRLKEGKYKSKLLLQIHDELILEVTNDELDEVTKLVEDTMTNVIKLKVKLSVSRDIGQSWYEV